MKNVSNLDISAVIPVFPIKKGYLTLKTFSGKNQNYVFFVQSEIFSGILNLHFDYIFAG